VIASDGVWEFFSNE